MDVGELLGQVICVGIACSVVASVWIPMARIAAGLLLLGFAFAVAALTAWALVGGHDIQLGYLFLTIAGLGLAGALFFGWGRRTTAA